MKGFFGKNSSRRNWKKIRKYRGKPGWSPKTLVVMIVAGILAAVGFFSTAWFVNNTQAIAQGVVVNADEIPVFVEGFWTLWYKDNGNTLTSQWNGGSQLSQSVTMNPFDVVKNENSHTALVLKIPVYGAEIERGTALKLSLEIEKSPENMTLENLVQQRLLSNIIEVYAGFLTSEPDSDLDFWTEAVKASRKETPKTFITGSKETQKKQEKISFTISNYSPPASGKPLNLYLVIDYNIDLVDQVIHNKSVIKFGSSLLSNTFSNDFQILSVTADSSGT